MGGLVILLGLGIGAFLVASTAAKKERSRLEGARPPSEIPGLEPSLAAEVSRLLLEEQNPDELDMWADQLEMVGDEPSAEAALLLRERAEELRQAAAAGKPPPDAPAGMLPVPPTEAELDEWAALGDELVTAAVGMCPAAEPQIRTAHSAFVVEFMAAPKAAYDTLLATVRTHCPAAPDPLETPSPTADPILPGDDQAMALAIVDEAKRVGCENVSPQLVGNFQSAAGLARSGVYDFGTAVAVQERVAPAAAPAPCRFPAWEAMTSPDLVAEILAWADTLDSAAGPLPVH